MALAAGSRLGPYEILDRLGAGGMGEVYRARDTRLGREVAVKILPAAHARDAESVRRFEKEARAVASLAHPHVVPLFDVGEQEGVRYAVAELVQGETLRARLASGPLPASEAAEIAAGVAEGLAAAHAKGIVHRDIKPENIILTRAAFARILDFGLAKTSQPAMSATGSEEEATQSGLVTEPGVVAGTVGYMSPEQVRGEAVDGRSDIFSLGVVLWEMLSGKRPFRGSSQVETLHAILKQEPPPEEWAALPRELEEIVRRCLGKHPEHRYHSAADLAHDLRKVAASPPPVSASIPRSVAADHLPMPGGRKRRRRILFGALGLLVATLLAVLVTMTGRRPAAPATSLPRTLAVLPFRPIRGAGMPEGFGLGLADSLIGHLAAVRELAVRPTSAISRYETAPSDAADVGRKLDVEAVLEGTYQKLEGMTRVSVQMTDVSRGTILWSERIDLPEGRLFEIQDTISRQVVEKLRGELDPVVRRALGKAQRVPDRVMEEYLAARARLIEVRFSDAATRRAVAASFDRVLAEEPNFVPALGARAYARAALAFREPTRENYRAALSDADRASALDTDLVEARLARATLAWSPDGGWDVVRAVRELKRAISRSPGLDIARSDLARVYVHSGWLSEAEAELRAIERILPSAEAAFLRADILQWEGEPREALERFRRLPQDYQTAWTVRWGTASLLVALEDPRRAEPEIVRLLKDSPGRASYLAILATLRARSGRKFDDLEREALSGKARGGGNFHHVQHSLAQAHAAAGDIPGSVEFLRQAVENGFPCGPCFDDDPLLAPVRGSTVYGALRSEIDRRNAGYRAALKDVL